MSEDPNSDRERFRATYGQTYPTSIQKCMPGNSQKTLSQAKVKFEAKNKSFEKFTFVSCQFLIAKNTSSPGEPSATETCQIEISYLTFRECNFLKTFLGGVAYLNCRFTDCTFDNSDFGSSKFVDCEFTDCRFDGCTAWNTHFARTTIDPTSFVGHLVFPIAHYHDVPTEMPKSKKKFLKAQLAIANQLVESLSASAQSGFSDGALYYAKLYDFYVRSSRILDWSRYKRLHLSKFQSSLQPCGGFC